MPELRKDYVTDTWVVFSPIRSRRPGIGRAGMSITDPKTCPFCYGHEHMTPPEILAYRKDGLPNTPGWWVRCMPNLYPALRVEGEVERTVHQVFHHVSGVGAHEIIVETPDHERDVSALSESQVSEILTAYRDRYRDLTRDKRFKYILIFKNHGERAGSSISHPHSQLIALPIVPRRIMEEVNAVNRYYATTGGSCLYCEMLAIERKDGRRIVAENDSFICLSPYGARFAFEMWILPKVHEMAFEDFTDEERAPLAKILRHAMSRLYHVLDDPPYNYYVHTAPCDRTENRYHWHLEIVPRLTETAGFETGTDFYINPVLPEDAAAILRGDVPAK